MLPPFLVKIFLGVSGMHLKSVHEYVSYSFVIKHILFISTCSLISNGKLSC